jgi:hypothetical protein
MSFNVSDGQSQITGDFSKLEKLIKNLKSDAYVDIGIFKEAKTSDGMPVAEYGAYNEFGSLSRKDRPPKRSFIRMPLEQKGDKVADYVEKKAKGHLEKGDVKAIFEDIGIAGESVIQEAFDTRGFGSWKENADSTIDRKGSDAPLIDEGLLRRSVTHKTGGKE